MYSIPRYSSKRFFISAGVAGEQVGNGRILPLWCGRNVSAPSSLSACDPPVQAGCVSTNSDKPDTIVRRQGDSCQTVFLPETVFFRCIRPSPDRKPSMRRSPRPGVLCGEPRGQARLCGHVGLCMPACRQGAPAFQSEFETGDHFSSASKRASSRKGMA